MFANVLVANRGEIALRVMRTLHAMGMRCTAVYSREDADHPHVGAADETFFLGEDPYSYLSVERIFEACEELGVDAIHPGYGFLSEDERFVRMCEERGISFIGPSRSAMHLFGSKLQAREFMRGRGVPVVPGSGELGGLDDALQAAEGIGYPVILKASGGGGGKGMKIVRSEEEMERMFGLAKREAERYFSSVSIYLEKVMETPRHVEVQVLGDLDGDVVHLWERECSIQRRHQKMIEESPAPCLDEEARRNLCESVMHALEGVCGLNACTFEFLSSGQGGEPLFLEANMRIQVEHTVTEAVSSLDIVREQVMLSLGGEAPSTPPERRGHAIQFRITAEDPANGFMPSAGRIDHVAFPCGVGIRVDHALVPGMDITTSYDPLLAKLVVWAPTREEALRRAREAFASSSIGGIRTSIPFHTFVLGSLAFTEGTYNTSYLEFYEGMLRPMLEKCAAARPPPTGDEGHLPMRTEPFDASMQQAWKMAARRDLMRPAVWRRSVER